MSATALHPRPRRAARTERPRPASNALPLATLIPFAGLALYGALRWGTMLSPDPVWRLLGMWALAMVIVLLGQTPVARRTWPAAPIALAALLIVLPLGGFRVSWVLHLRIALSEQTIRQGLAGLPAVLVPYNGVNVPIRQVMTMGAGVLLVDGALMLAFAPRGLGELRAAVAALPLVVLAIVPAAMARPHLAYLHGAALFLLLALLVWGERIASARRGIAALLTVIVAGGAAVLAAPAIDSHHPWLDFRNFASAFGAGKGERFDWAQGYGPLNWPRKGHQVLQIQAPFASYWKTENLETFDGAGWTDQAANYGSYGVSEVALQHWTETLHVTDTDMSSQEVIAAGTTAAPPTHLPGYAIPGNSAGTWTLAEPLRPGDSYLVTAYAPHPTAAQLRAAGTAYPEALASGYLSTSLPAFAASGVGPVTPLSVFWPPFHSSVPLAVGGNITHATGIRLVDSSPYGATYRLAQRLAAASATPYDFAEAIKHYLAHGYTYDEHPPASTLPIVTFLFRTHHGYCQQFAGAMALLLRMGGVPARVATGFTTGRYQSSTHSWSVDDTDAHAWVEAWFPGYGWVTFEPTPSADPALGGKIPPPQAAPISNFKPLSRRGESGQTPTTTTAAGAAAGSHSRGGGSSALPVLAVLGGVLVLALVLARTALAVRARRVDPVQELERAFARCGRPLPGGTTLQGLEHRFRHTPEAAAYVRALRLARYGPSTGRSAEPQGRRALRSQLSPWRGPLGWLRTLWALPPAPGRRSGRSGRSRRGGHLESRGNG